ncbi:eukaryotic translation initiation factor 4E member 3 [Heterostelium album PN500]|uniref:Eukaryotic translation initiation factor 4E member 3 n=1 Tax=Heterostelium pallidum (strain ATCC 26659 / Pp 5 / PN500) TaxID=670386 RepID=D3BVM4_HETP5|nr:eukaryotic translation initiation factor 4E member 3 [Heterostelium album PN500]EFA74527.1 eukaryotic translation initiation factor 4E member 3 [Heterostelium album PN500]|eukprot:XP_020426661.1 eukaryotic translation initiation factor 4E member 3 [Heterostelium album PN500]
MEVEECQVQILKDTSLNREDKSKNKVKFVAQEKKKEEEQILPLENGWSFWEDHYINHGERATQEEYLASLKQISSFSSVQGFWTEFNKLPHLSKVPNNSCFHLMKKDVRPIWEDPENENGGVLILKVKKYFTDEIWNELVLSVIGEQFSSYLNSDDDICGVSIRKKSGMDFNMIHIWNKTSSGQSAITRALKHLVPFLPDGCINQYYRIHAQDQSKTMKHNDHPQPIQQKDEESVELESKIDELKKELKKEISILNQIRSAEAKLEMETSLAGTSINKEIEKQFDFELEKEVEKEIESKELELEEAVSKKQMNDGKLAKDGLEEFVEKEEAAENQRLAAAEKKKQAEAEKKRMEMEQKRRLAEEAEKKRLAQETSKKRLAEEAAEKKRMEQEEEKKLMEMELEKKRLEKEIENQRLAKERKRLEEIELERELEDELVEAIEEKIERDIEEKIEKRAFGKNMSSNNDLKMNTNSTKQQAKELKKEFDNDNNNNKKDFKSNITKAKVYDVPTLEEDD